MHPVVINGLISLDNDGVSLAREDTDGVNREWVMSFAVSFDDSQGVILDLEMKADDGRGVDNAETIAFSFLDFEDGPCSLRIRRGPAN
jgi:hypothetical protein